MRDGSEVRSDGSEGMRVFFVVVVIRVKFGELNVVYVVEIV